jgi:hypothetical protein
MNDLGEFAEVALAIFVALTLLIWLLTYLERTLIRPVTDKRGRRVIGRKNPVPPEPPEDPASPAPPENDLQG